MGRETSLKTRRSMATGGQSKAKGASLATPMWAALRPHAAKSGCIQAVLQLCDGRCITIELAMHHFGLPFM